MKYKVLVLGLLSATIITIINVGCMKKEVFFHTASAQPQSTDTQITSQILLEKKVTLWNLQAAKKQFDCFYRFISESKNFAKEDKTGVRAEFADEESKVALIKIDCAMQAIGRDRIPEGLVGTITTRDGGRYHDSEFYAGYTSVTKDPGLTLESWIRNRHYYTEEFWQIKEKPGRHIHTIKLIPFSKYKLTSQDADQMNPQVRVEWAKDALANYVTYNEFIADTTESQVKILFTTESSVQDFQVLALTLEKVDSNGKVIFATKKLYELESLTPECPLVVGMTFFGDTPAYGISYVDKNGLTRSYAVEVSGKDGTLLLTEI